MKRLCSSELVADPDIAAQLSSLETRVLGGRAIGIVNNHFIDLPSAIGGSGTVLNNDDPSDIRRENLSRLRYALGTSGELVRGPIKAGFCRLAIPARTQADPVAGIEHAIGGIDPDSPFRYLPLGHTAQVPNISLDSIDNAATLLTLSHWPSNHTPQRYKANLSTQSAFRYLREGNPVGEARIVTSDHFDLDGLASIYAFLSPASALRHQDLLIDVARLGDFSRGTSPQALRVAFTLNSLAAQAKRPGVLDADTALLQTYRAVLPQVGHVLEHPGQYAHCYVEGMHHLARSERLLSHPETRLVEYKDVDLAVFHLPAVLVTDHLDYQQPYFGLSNIAFHNRTRCGVVAIVHGAALEVRQRYESWVERISEIPRPRRDLAIFTRALQQDEREGCTWHYGGVENIMPALKCANPGATRYSSEMLLMELRQFLAVAPVAWRGSRSGSASGAG